MAVKIAPDARRQFVNASGVPYSGAKLFYYASGSTTKQNTYTTSAGSVANSNPVVLDSAGRTPYGVWLTAGLTYKEVLAPSTDTDPPGSPIYTEDGISGINDTSVTVSQWAASALTPTYISGTSFSVAGDQTSELHIGRRLQLSVTAGTVYARISNSVYGALTTVTVVMDSGALDSGLSSFNWSILTATNHAIPKLTTTQLTGLGIANTTDYATLASPALTGTPTAPTAAATADSTQIATTGHVLDRLQRAPAFDAGNASSQSLTTGVAAKVNFGTEVSDSNGNFASSRFTPTVAGYYQINWSVNFLGAPLTNGNVSYMSLNGSEYTRGGQINAASAADITAFGSIGSTVIYMSGIGDYIEIWAQATGTTLSIATARFSGCLIRPA